MKVGDVVSWNGKVCVITELYESKVWRTSDLGKKVNFSEIDSEPFARIVRASQTYGVPSTDLEVISESQNR